MNENKDINLTEDLLKQLQFQKTVLARQEKALALAKLREQRNSFLQVFMMVTTLCLLFIFFITEPEFREIIANLLGRNSAITNIEIFILILAILGVTITGPIIVKFVRDTVRSEEEIIDTRKSEGDNSSEKSYVKFNFFGFNAKLNLPENNANFSAGDEHFYFMETGECFWLEPLIYSRIRLLSEIRRLHSRSASNLTIGMIMSTLGVVFLLSMLIYPNWYESSNSLRVFSMDLDVKVLVFIFSQVLAGFFLKLFVGNERNISELNKEILTLDYRLAAATSGIENEVEEFIIEKFLNEERVAKSTKVSQTVPTNSLDLISETLKEIKKNIVK